MTENKNQETGNKPEVPFALGPKNYRIMLGGIALLIIGFLVMSADTEQHGFGFLGLTLGPILVVLAFAVQFAAILYRPKE